MSGIRTAYLVMTNIPHREWSAKIEERRKRIGRAPDADIPIPARFGRASRSHAEVWCDRYGLWIRDLGSKSGTTVNRIWVDHVPQAGLDFGDRIWLGGPAVEVVREVDELARIKRHNRLYNNEGTPDPMDPQPGRESGRLLSRAEVDVVLCLSRGRIHDEEIGQFLHRSPQTVQTEVRNLLKKLDLHSRAGVLGWFEQDGRP